MQDVQECSAGGGKQASKQVSKLGQTARQPANWPASKKASKQAGQTASQPASQQESKPASKLATRKATCRGGDQGLLLYTMRSRAYWSTPPATKQGRAFSPPSSTPVDAARSRTCTQHARSVSADAELVKPYMCRMLLLALILLCTCCEQEGLGMVALCKGLCVTSPVSTIIYL